MRYRSYRRKESEFEKWLGSRYVIHLYLSLIIAVVLTAPLVFMTNEPISDPTVAFGTIGLMFFPMCLMATFYFLFLSLEYGIFRLSKYIDERRKKQ